MAKTKGIETKKGGINWARKLTSRKFWLSLASFVSMMSVALGENKEQATQLTALVMAGGAVVTYVLGEGMSDASGIVRNQKD
ncbi:MAG: hypothetical protein IJP69_04715 [Synergistaceae bacterium]|nr:hypothetical protein [Synergistaceae bacterium]